MNKIYMQAKDKNVAGVCVYVKSGDTYAYADAKYTQKIDNKTLRDMFLKGMIIIDATVEYKPTSCAVASGVATITYLTAGASNAATLKTITSSEATTD